MPYTFVVNSEWKWYNHIKLVLLDYFIRSNRAVGIFAFGTIITIMEDTQLLCWMTLITKQYKEGVT